MDNVHSKLLSDLEIYEKIVPKLDKTITSYGSSKFRELFGVYFYGKGRLMRRQQIILSILSNPRKVNTIITLLKQVKEKEQMITWLFEEDKEIKDLYFDRDVMNVKEILTIRNFMKIYSPSLIIIIYILLYIILRYKSVNISLVTYFRNIYNSYRIFIYAVLNSVSKYNHFNSFLANFLTTMYILYQLYGIYNSFDSSIVNYKKSSALKNKYRESKELIKLIKAIYDNDQFFILEKQLILSKIEKIKITLNKNKSIGSILLFKKNISHLEKTFNIALQYVGLIDSFIAISKLLQTGSFALPQFDFMSQRPYINAHNLWNPFFKFKQILNDCQLGHNVSRSPFMVLTGPNTSGKSTYIKNIALSIFLAQTIGISCCQYIIFTPFRILFSYIDIPNISRQRESLFEAELKRCYEYCSKLREIPENEFSFVVIDELFTGTNPQEGIAGSYSICEYVSTFNNALGIITTHYRELVELATEFPQKFANKKFIIKKGTNGQIYRPYKLLDGHSDQNMGLELLRAKGFDDVIVDNALKRINKIK